MKRMSFLERRCSFVHHMPSLQIKVMNKQLLLFHNAISAYFSGNQKALDATMKLFAIKFEQPKAIDNEEL